MPEITQEILRQLERFPCASTKWFRILPALLVLAVYMTFGLVAARADFTTLIWIVFCLLTAFMLAFGTLIIRHNSAEIEMRHLANLLRSYSRGELDQARFILGKRAKSRVDSAIVKFAITCAALLVLSYLYGHLQDYLADQWYQDQFARVLAAMRTKGEVAFISVITSGKFVYDLLCSRRYLRPAKLLEKYFGELR